MYTGEHNTTPSHSGLFSRPAWLILVRVDCGDRAKSISSLKPYSAVAAQALLFYCPEYLHSTPKFLQWAGSRNNFQMVELFLWLRWQWHSEVGEADLSTSDTAGLDSHFSCLEDEQWLCQAFHCNTFSSALIAAWLSARFTAVWCEDNLMWAVHKNPSLLLHSALKEVERHHHPLHQHSFVFFLEKTAIIWIYHQSLAGLVCCLKTGYLQKHKLRANFSD